MKRELIALILLALLIIGAAINLACVDQLTHLVCLNLNRSEKAAAYGDFETARKSYETGFSVWQSARHYTSVFLRHPDVDAAADAFYDLQQLLFQEDSNALPAAYARLRYHLDVIDYMEHPSIGTIF